MITPRWSSERQHVRVGQQELWRTFRSAPYPVPPAEGFGTLLAFDEVSLSPGGVSPCRPCEETEVLTYVHRGALAQEDSSGGSGMVQAGEVQRMTTGRGVRHKETNASRSDWAHLFRVTLRASEVGLGCAREQSRFVLAQLRNVLCVVASTDGQRGSLRLLQDALLYSGVLDSGRHLIHQILPRRNAWLHVISGKATSQDHDLTGGDGLGVFDEPSISLTAREDTEILLVDLGPAPGSYTCWVAP